MPGPTPQATPIAKTWTDLPVSKPENRITIHYHRADASYEGVNLYTWDGYNQKTPKLNVATPLGNDAFGVVFQIDRANYGGTDKIGLIPRVGNDWSQKDGGDKFWTLPLGNEIWLIQKKEKVFGELPNVSPSVEVAYLDAPDKIVARLSQSASPDVKVSVLDENNQVLPVIVADSAALELQITPLQPLDIMSHAYRLQVEGMGSAVPLTPRALLDNRELFFEENAILGATYTPQATTFRLFAPTAKTVSIAFYNEASGSAGRVVQPLQKQAKGIWEAVVGGDQLGKFYTYLLDGPELDPTREVLDPYTINSVANSTRARVSKPPQTPVTAGPKIGSPTDMVIYEMHVRDFTIAANSGVKNRGLYLGFTEPNTRLVGDPQIRTALDHLTELGVTHVQLLPVQDFDNDEASRKYNWGYVTSAFFSPEGMFATNLTDDSRMRELKALIDALHARGIGVIMDVVYNHTAANASFLSIARPYYYRHAEDGALANGSGCGNEFRSEAPMTRKLILDSLKFWVTQYGVDGFRFDLMGLLDQKTMTEADRELRAINPSIVLYGEPWTATSTPLQNKTDKEALRKVNPVGAFNDDFRNALHGHPDGPDSGWIQNGSSRDDLKKAMLVSDWFAAPGQQLNYLTCHDNLVLWDKLKISMPGASDQLRKETMKVGYLALFTSQGVPFIHGGEEFARSKGGNSNSYDSPDSVNEVDWSLKRKNLDLFTYTRNVIALRKAHPVFRLRTREEIARRLNFEDTANNRVLMFSLNGSGVPGESWQRVCVVLNSDEKPAEVNLPSGAWSVAFDARGEVKLGAISAKIVVPQKSGTVLFQR